MVASLLAWLMLLTAVVCFSVVTVMGLHVHVVVAPAYGCTISGGRCDVRSGTSSSC